MAMQSGRLREIVRLERNTPVADETGQEVAVWSTFVTRRADVIPSRGDESFRAAAERAQITIKVFLRYLSGVDTTMRVIWRGDAYQVQYVDETSRHKGELWLMATAEVV